VRIADDTCRFYFRFCMLCRRFCVQNVKVEAKCMCVHGKAMYQLESRVGDIC
jgi:hypothetical protein